MCTSLIYSDSCWVEFIAINLTVICSSSLHDRCSTNCATDAENFSEIHNIYTLIIRITGGTFIYFGILRDPPAPYFDPPVLIMCYQFFSTRFFFSISNSKFRQFWVEASSYLPIFKFEASSCLGSCFRFLTQVLVSLIHQVTFINLSSNINVDIDYWWFFNDSWCAILFTMTWIFEDFKPL